MRKIPTIFERDWDGDRGRVLDKVNPEAQWVFDGEGVATEKIDGTACLIRGGALFKRYELKSGKTPPEGFEAAGEADPVTGKTTGWVPVGDGPADKYHREAFCGHDDWIDGTYELVGPKIQSNPHGLTQHLLVLHGASRLGAAPRDYQGLVAYLTEGHMEGIVWHHPDGRMAKIKSRDLGIKWP